MYRVLRNIGKTHPKLSQSDRVAIAVIIRMEFYAGDVLGKHKLLETFLTTLDTTQEERRNKFGLTDLTKIIQFAYLLQPSRFEYPEMNLASLLVTARNALTEEGCRAFVEILDMLSDFSWREEPGIIIT